MSNDHEFINSVFNSDFLSEKQKLNNFDSFKILKI